MKKLSKLKLKEFREMSDSEMKNVVGGYFDPWDGGGTGNIDGGSGGGEGGATSCSDHTSPEECFGDMVEIVDGHMIKGKCEWKIFPEISYAGCVFVG